MTMTTNATMTAPNEPQDNATTHSSTRVCIKNVPLSFNETKLRQHLQKSCSKPLIITDCRILKTPQGKSRKLAFCGFTSPEMATAVIQEFHETFALTCKLSVEAAFSKTKSAQEQLMHRPWSQHSVGSSRYQAKHAHEQKERKNEKEDKKIKESKQKKSVDEKKEEFLAAMGASAKPWANDDIIVETPANAPDNDESSSSSSSGDSDDSDVDSVDSGGEGADVLKSSGVPTAPHASVVSDLDFIRSKTTAVENLSDDDDSSSSDSSDEELSDKEETDKKKPVEDDVSSSSDSDSSDDASSDDESDNDEPKETAPAQPEADNDEAHETRPSSTSSSQEDPNRLFVRNLPFTTTEEELQQYFEYFGTVTDCHVPVDDQKQHKGFAFVSFSNAQDATRARTELDGTDFQGRLLHILPAKRSNNTTNNNDVDVDEQHLTYKQKQERARQQNATSSKGWSASFVRGDAVVDNLAERLGLRKGDVLNVKDDLSSGDAAVRLALGETHIIEENREYFKNEGVDMDALVSLKGDNSKRSTTAILVKNLPYETELEELTRLFHGVTGSDAPQRILLAPSRTIAMVEYGHATDAKRVFRKLAYKRFKHVPLYLEWAPLAAKLEDAPITTQDATSSAFTTDKDEELADDEPTEPDVSHTIYVKNLNFRTTEEELQRTFAKHVKSIRAVKIPTKTAPIKKFRGGGATTTEGEVNYLSMGFGFVECDSEESVRKAIKALQGTILDGHALELKRSSKTVASSVPVKRKQSGSNPTKLMVRNVPFQATRKELLQLFGSFGQLKKVRLPKKFDGTHRGFAFVEFLTHQEALTAMNTLSRTHLYGRHLVLEWASDKEDLDTLREKAQRDVTIPPPPKNKRIRFQ